jgi:hypothetical protein
MFKVAIKWIIFTIFIQEVKAKKCKSKPLKSPGVPKGFVT